MPSPNSIVNALRSAQDAATRGLELTTYPIENSDRIELLKKEAMRLQFHAHLLAVMLDVDGAWIGSDDV